MYRTTKTNNTGNALGFPTPHAYKTMGSNSPAISLNVIKCVFPRDIFPVKMSNIDPTSTTPSKRSKVPVDATVHHRENTPFTVYLKEGYFPRMITFS
jgi:putative lipoic acid-binding regulatory protein